MAIGVVIIGAEKAGTSSLVRWLDAQPGVCGIVEREYGHFVQPTSNYESTVDAHFGRCGKNDLLVAKSVGIMYSDAALDRLKKQLPDTVVVALLRDPVLRAHSAYWFQRRAGRERLGTFEEALEAEPARARQMNDINRHLLYRQRGEYAARVTQVRARFPDAMFFKFEEFITNPEEVVVKILLSAGHEVTGVERPVDVRANSASRVRSSSIARLLLPTSLVAQFARRFLSFGARSRLRGMVRRVNESTMAMEAMDVATERTLASYFAPLNVELREELDMNLDDWTGLS